MPLNPTDVHAAYDGMSSSIPASELPKTLCQSAVGFVPGRNGKLDLAPLIKRIQRAYGITIYGTAVWTSELGVGDRLLLIDATKVYSLLLATNAIADSAWKIDEREDGPHSYYQLPATLTTVFTGITGADNGVVSVQFGDELILSIGGVLYRYYVDSQGLGTEKFYLLGLTPPGVPVAPAISITGQSTGGSLTAGQTYYYEITWVDELGRESSPSPTISGALTGSNNKFSLSRLVSVPSNMGITYWNLYRLNPGQTSYRFVAQIAVGTTTYDDTSSDAVVNAADAAPDDGENDPPFGDNAQQAGTANILCVWKSRLVMNSVDDPNRLQISNVNSPTQFSSLPLPTDLDDGLQWLMTAKGQNRITGLANLGSLLAVFTHDTTHLLYGDDISDFTGRETLQRGCINPNSIQRTENEIQFLSDDGIYTIGYESGYAVAKRSVAIDDIFKGLKWLKNPKEPTSKWRWQDANVASSIFPNVNSFYMDNRYYLSLYNRTICMDVRTGGWTDTGWGFVKTATRYFSGQEDYSSLNGFGLTSAPETMFLTFGDPTTWATELSYFTSADTPGDRDAPISVTAELVMRPVGIEQDVDVRKKRVAWYSQTGTCDAKRGEVIGQCVWTVDGKTLPSRPVYAYLTSKRQGALFEMNGPIAAGQEIFATLTFTGVKQLSLTSAIFETCYLN